MNELTCARCKKFVKNEKVKVEADGKTIVCMACLEKPIKPDDKPAFQKKGSKVE